MTQAPAPITLFGRYRLLDTLSESASRTVYQARDLHFPNIQKLVVVKAIPLPAVKLTAETLRTLPIRQEADLLAALDHPAIPKVFEFTIREGYAYLITEYIQGVDLAAHMAHTPKIAVRQIMEWGMALCDALHYLHTREPHAIIHRNLQPANILIDTLGRVRLVGFSRAVMVGAGEGADSFAVAGYAPPEAEAGAAAPTVDVYMLAAALHHLITRVDPATQPDHSFETRPLRAAAPDAPEALERVLRQALAVDPAERFQTAADFKAALGGV